MLYLANGLSLLRSETQDVPAGADWFIPLVEAIAVVREYGYREALGLPQLIADPHDAAAYRAFMDLVLAGEPDPVAAWSARHPHQPLGS